MSNISTKKSDRLPCAIILSFSNSTSPAKETVFGLFRPADSCWCPACISCELDAMPEPPTWTNWTCSFLEQTASQSSSVSQSSCVSARPVLFPQQWGEQCFESLRGSFAPLQLRLSLVSGYRATWYMVTRTCSGHALVLELNSFKLRRDSATGWVLGSKNALAKSCEPNPKSVKWV